MEQTIENTKKKPYNYKWTLEALQADAKKYKSRSEWKANSGGAYVAARKGGWLDQCCKHMVALKKPNGYWTLERCIADAKKYKTRIEWSRNSSAAYTVALERGLMDQCCGHMKEMLYWGPKIIREFLFAADIDHVKEKRFDDLRNINPLRFDFYLPKYHLVIEYHGRQHREDSKGFRGNCNASLINHDRIKEEYCKTNRIYYIAILEWEVKKNQDIIDIIIRKINCINALNGLEAESFKELKPLTKEQQNLCDVRAHWTLENCIADAKKYKARTEWQKKSSGAYDTAFKNGWVDQCCGHMVRDRRKPIRWPLERCIADAKKYKTRSEWQKKSANAYAAACRRGWIDLCCGHMISPNKPSGYWTLELCKTDAKKYKTRSEWKIKSSGVYKTACKMGWMDQCCKHMVRGEYRPLYWTLERCIADAKKYKTRTEWQKKSSGAYAAACKSGSIDLCCGHMISPNKPHGYWTLEVCQADAKKYKTRAEWRKNSNGYSVANSKNWLDQCCKHMIALKQLWPFADIVATTKGFTNYSAWKKANPRTYHALARFKRYDEIRALFN